MPDLEELLSYIESIHRRTERVSMAIPPSEIEHSFGADRFTPGDLVRHVAGVNRYMFVEVSAGRKNLYPGHEASLAAGFDATLEYQRRLHEEGMAILRQFTQADLERKCETPAGAPIRVSKWLRAMVEHEAHHRGQLYWMLAELGVRTPPLFGLTSEEVREKATKA